MKQPDSNDHEWFQATIVLGNFATEREAYNAITALIFREDFITSEVKGSWH